MADVQDRYDISKDVLFGPNERIDVTDVAAAQTPWWNRTLTEVNDAVVRLAVMEGDFHWHKHDEEDEFFYVVDGELLIDIRGSAEGQESRTVALRPGQGFVVPKTVVHRTRAPKRTTILMVENAGITPTGN
jgi:mannose-6-phosphate isomerase-like protein (cupin superfamily)